MSRVLDDVFKRSKFVIAIMGIYIVINGNKSNIMLREKYLCVIPCL